MPESPAPDWAREVRARLVSLRLRPEREIDIVEELAQHLDDRYRELIAGGTSADEAARATLAQLRQDTLARYMAPLRQSHSPSPIAPGSSSGHLLGDLWRDLRYACHAMAASPGFSLVAALSLALGVGANTAIFSLWNGVLHASLPGVEKPEELVVLSDPNRAGGWTGNITGVRSWLSYGEFEELRDRAQSFSGLMASQSSLSVWPTRVGTGPAEDAFGRFVSGEFFDVLGARPAIGRLFTAIDDGADVPSAVISYPYWQRRFGGRPEVLGTTISVRNAVMTIVGVTAPPFIGETAGQQPDMWLPLRLQPLVNPGADRLQDRPPQKLMWLHVFGRLKPGVTMAQAGAEANTIFRAGLEAFYGTTLSAARRRELLDQRLHLSPGAGGASTKRLDLSTSLTALLAAVGVLLLMACANLANLLLARGAARQSEMAIRLSLGASRHRLIRQLITESLVMASLGGIAAVGVASLLHGGLVQMMAKADSDFRMTFALDPAVLLFLLLATVLAAVMFGVLPALQVTKSDAAQLREQGRGALGSRHQSRAGRALVALQLALSLPLLMGAGLLAQTVYNLRHADLGFSAERLLFVQVDVHGAGYRDARRDSVLRDLRERIAQIPGVHAVSFSELGVFSGGESAYSIQVEGYTAAGADDSGSALDSVGPAYFSTLGAPILFGRDMLDSDLRDQASVCVINEAFAARFFDKRNPLGMHITLVNDPARTTLQVVGIARNARTQQLRGDVEPRFFMPATGRSSATNSPTFLIRTVADAAPLMTAVRKTVETVDATLPIVSAASIDDQMAPLTAQDRALAELAAAFGAVALLLVAVGLYGVLSYGVARRSGEIAIRMALGARAGRVVSMILGETMTLMAIGLVAGAALAYAGSRVIDSRLYGVGALDPLTLVVATGLLLAVALTAAYLPARRASKLEPMTALRR